MAVCYGSGGCCCGKHIRRVEQDEPVRLGEGARHGTQIAYELYGCRCRKCSGWFAREQMLRKGSTDGGR